MIYPILFIIIVLYIWLDNNILLNSHLLTYILLHIELALMVVFPNLPYNVYPVFSVKLTVTIKKTRLNRKQIEISLGFFYNKYKVQEATFKSITLNLQCKIIKKTVKSYKQFSFIYVQLLQLRSLEEVSLLKLISFDNINNQPHYELQMDNERLQKLINITLLLFTNAIA